MAQKDGVMRKVLEALRIGAFVIFGCMALIITVVACFDPLTLSRGFLTALKLVIPAVVIFCSLGLQMLVYALAGKGTGWDASFAKEPTMAFLRCRKLLRYPRQNDTLIKWTPSRKAVYD